MHQVVQYLETTKYPHMQEDEDRRDVKFTRQVKELEKQKSVKKFGKPKEPNASQSRSEKQEPARTASMTISISKVTFKTW